MLLAFVLFALGAVVDVALPARALWRMRTALAFVALGATGVASVLLVVQYPGLGSVLVLLLSGYRTVNNLRIISGRLRERYVRRAALRTSVVVLGLQVLVGAGWLAWHQWAVTGHALWAAVAGVQLLAAGVALWSMLRSVRTTAWPGRISHYSDDELPSVSVVVPARNETDDLQACLRSIIASDYPKLEVARQRNTAVRVRYPQVHRRPEQVAVHSFLEAAFLLLPFVLAAGGFWLPIGWPAQVLAALACACLIATHLLVTLSTRVNAWWFGLIAPPLMILVDIALLHNSMYKYEFSTVEWKGRNIAAPAMHAIPHLSKV